ncbi:MAG: hydroxypyruvate isomerase family protein [Gemmataceae bacterium]|jgi:hydroxypyruvate isomerase
MMNRRNMLAAGAGMALGSHNLGAAEKLKGNIRHSACSWCFISQGDKWNLDQLCEQAKSLGCVSIELLRPQQFATVKKHGLEIAIASNGMPGGFKKGFNNPAYREELLKHTRETIDACAEFKVPTVIGFVGFKYQNADDVKSPVISLEDAEKNCVEGLKQIAGYAEKKGVTVAVEHLNTRDGSHPMTGHPGYQGDDVDWLAGVLRKVGSPRIKLLFDIYHVQIMHGDVIRRIEQHKDVIAHIHTAGNPGRHELDENQEIQYLPIMKKLVQVGYKGFVGHEFIPTRNAREGLKQAILACDA